MLNEDRFPGEIRIEDLGEAVLALASRNQRLREDLGPAADEPQALRLHLDATPSKPGPEAAAPEGRSASLGPGLTAREVG